MKVKKRFESKEQFFPPSMDDIISLSLYLSRPERLWFLNERPSTFYSFIPQCYYACVYMQIFHKILCILSLAPSLPPVRLSMSVDVSCSLSLYCLFVCLPLTVHMGPILYLHRYLSVTVMLTTTLPISMMHE